MLATMISPEVLLIVIVILGIWLLLLSWRLLMIQKYFKQLLPEGDDKALSKKFIEWTQALNQVNQREALLIKNLKGLSVENLNNLQKIRLVRYNPYQDDGGDQSFSIIFLDGHENGLIISSLHNRASTRIYAKNVKAGKPEMTLSKEEADLLKSTLEG